MVLVATQPWLQVRLREDALNKYRTHRGHTEYTSLGCCHAALPKARPSSWNFVDMEHRWLLWPLPRAAPATFGFQQ